MAKTREIYQWIENLAPKTMAEDWDPVGEQVYFEEEEIHGILITMDVTKDSIEYALKNECNTILSHHPMFFKPLYQWTSGDYFSDLLETLILNRISVLSAHTNLDRAKNGVNDALAKTIGMEVIDGLNIDPEKGSLGLIGYVRKQNPTEFETYIKKALNPFILHWYGKKPEKIEKIGICGGSGSDFMKDALAHGVDVYITGDMKYHDGQWAYENNLSVLDIGHYDSEKPILYRLKGLLEKNFPSIPIKIYDNNLFQISIV
ncbi:MAG: Nif3-like dinuclear metal center hexameric protein [Tissierellia bacterium]|nr:Nif3-like dinuclear metal center hexameric protein [Tissierellia bacterium]